VTRRFDRLLHLGNVVVDVVLTVPELPERGGDMLAATTEVTPGGGFNVIMAAARQGLPVGYAGGYGSGPFAALALAALRQAGVEVLQPPKRDADTGFVVALVDDGGERTFVTSRGAEAMLTAADLAGVRAGPRDAVYLSGYGLAHPSNRPALLGWLDRLGQDNVVFFDPGPLGASVPADALDRVLRRAGWLTCNAREAARLTGTDDPVAAAAALASRWAAPSQRSPSPSQRSPAPSQRSPSPTRGASAEARRQRGVLVRTGPDGCLLARPGAPPVRVPGFPVDAVDTNGAGDTHTGTFIAALAAGADALAAARTANAAAALSVTRPGPATAPTKAELARFLAAHAG
jgi:sugar/nucleoside kinase (ribokinase family)